MVYRNSTLCVESGDYSCSRFLSDAVYLIMSVMISIVGGMFLLGHT
jgi:hypothetical protein